MKDNIYDIIIVGAGPAGLTAAIYAKRALKKVLVLEAITYGGQIINTKDIENYPGYEHISGIDFATKLYNQAKNLGAEIKFERVVDLTNEEVITTKNKYKTKTIILATGLVNRKLNLEHEKELIGKGISYCATCDGSFFKGKEVSVVGGGNVALEDAIYLSDICNKVYLIHRNETFKAEQVLIDKLKEKNNIEIILNTTIKELIYDEYLTGIKLSNDKYLNISGLFIAVGKIPENENFSKIINTDEYGYIISEDCRTNTPNIFVAGDNRTKTLRQLVTATNDGAVAATEAIKYINKNIN